MANWFTRALDVMTPWNRRGEQERRKKQQDQQQQQAPTARPVVNQFNQTSQQTLNGPQNQSVNSQKIQNLFSGLQNNLQLPGTPRNTTSVTSNNNQPVSTPKPGAVISPSQPRNPLTPPIQVKKPNFWGDVRTGFKQAGQTAVGVVSNLPEVGLATARAGTGLIEGLTQIPHITTAATATATQKLNEKLPNRVTHALNTGAQTLNTGVKKATNFVDTPIDYVNRGLDTVAKKYEQSVPTAYGGANAYRYTQIPINALIALATLGGGAAADAAGQAGRVGEAANAGRVTRVLNKPLTSNPDNIIARTGQVINNRTAPVANAVTNPFSTIKNGITRLVNNRSVPTVTNGVVDAGETGSVVSEAPNVVQIPVGQGITVNAPASTTTNVPVTVVPKPVGKPIIEVSGDTPGAVRMPTQEEVNAQRAKTAFNNQPKTKPDYTVDGVTPGEPNQPFKLDPNAAKKSQDTVVKEYADMLKSLGEGNGTQLVPDGTGGYIRTSNNLRNAKTSGKRMKSQDWIDEARKQLETGNAEQGAQQAYNDAVNPEVQSLLSKGEQAPTPTGKPITVKQAKGIPVKDETVVPGEDVSAPGTVRPTTKTAPTQAKTQAVADTQQVYAEASKSKIPVVADTANEYILNNTKQFTKRQVAAARNQRKLARQMAKTQEQTAEAITRIDNAKPVSDKGFVDTGEFGKGVHGDAYQKVNRDAEKAQAWHDIQNTSTGEVLSQSEREMLDNGSRTEQTVRNLKAKIDDPNVPKNTPEGKALISEYRDAIRRYAQGLALADRVVRTRGSAAQITNKFVNRIISVAKDSSKLTDADIASVDAANNAFTEARDTANALAEKFKASGSQEDFNAWKTAQKAVDQADRNAKVNEYVIAKKVLTNNKDDNALKALQDMEKEAGVYTMDSVDANMLSGTGTWVRNYINTLFPRAESALFGKLSSRIVKPISTVGGYSHRGSKIGADIGSTMFKSDVAARKTAGAGFIRRNVTAANTVGERNIQATAYSKGFDHYKQILKSEGYTGKELNNRAEFMARTDSEGIVKQYEADALQANALSSLTHTKKVENWLADKVQEAMAKGGFGSKGQQAGRFGAKAITRVGVGFPTVIGRSLVEGAKRATLGVPEALWSTTKFMKTGNKELFAQELSKSLQHAGSGASLMTLGAVLARHGVLTGGYPKDQAERDRWTSEGIQPNSIKIAGQYFSVPGYFGGFALPLMMGQSLFGGGDIKDTASLQNAWQAVLDASPVDNIQSTLDILTGNSNEAKIKNQVTSLVRTFTPAGALLAEIAKLTDSTKNDTTTKDAVMNILDSIAGGVPILNNIVNKTPKTDTYGNEIHNPNRVATVLGAQGSEQKAGVQKSADIQKSVDTSLQSMADKGAFSDPNLKAVLDDKTLKIYNSVINGKKVTDADLKKLQDAMVKGVSSTGEDTVYLEKGQYDSNITALKMKRDLMAADATTKPSDLKKMDTAITRGQVYKDNEVPYDMVTSYGSISLSEWRDMGDPESDNYDPTMYQKLWDVDQMLAKSGVSFNKNDMSKQKYSAKEAGSGRGGSRSYSSDFGQLKGSKFAPQVQQYQTIDSQPGKVPVINVVRPNIVHKIGS